MRRFRRPGRPIRRRIGRALRRGVPPLGPFSLLRVAHRRMADREFPQASSDYLAAAEEAQAQGSPQAARLFIAAGMAAIESGEAASGVELVVRGLGLLETQAPAQRVARVASRILGELNSRGHHLAAGKIEAYMLERGIDQQPIGPGVPETHRLPPECPQCGGRVHPGELEWVDSRTVLCDYCGSILQAEP